MWSSHIKSTANPTSRYVARELTIESAMRLITSRHFWKPIQNDVTVLYIFKERQGMKWVTFRAMNGWKSFTWVNQDMCQCYTRPVMKYGCHQGVCSPIDPCIVSCWISNHPGPCIDREKSAHENTYLVPLSPMYLLPKKNQLSWFICMLLHVFFRRASKAASAFACTDWIEKQCEKG